jgi:pyruvate/2-oxoglutarate dehydrogenase complex dihydrolipoamide acyltransferase (E2) component
MVVTLGTICTKKRLEKDGTYTEEEVLPVNFSFDHRYGDGSLAAKMIREVNNLITNR